MKRLSFLLSLCFPGLCLAQGAIIRAAHERMVCDNGERTLVAYLVMQRNAGTPVETMMDKAAGVAATGGERAIAEGRIRDVYLDRALTVDTLTAYRATKCLKGRLLRDDTPFADDVRAGLMQCQTQASPGDRAFGRCIDALLGRLDAHAGERASSS